MELDCSIDMWSVGCVLYELFMCEQLFSLSCYDETVDCYLAMIYQIVRLIGFPKAAYLRKCKKYETFFKVEGEKVTFSEFYELSQDWRAYLPDNFSVLLIEERIMSNAAVRKDNLKKASQLANLISAMLRYEPITPKEAMDHEFFASVLDKKPIADPSEAGPSKIA